MVSRLAKGKIGIEIGGPSEIFSPHGYLPVYSFIERLNNCNFSSETLWETKLKQGGSFFFNPAKKPGEQFLCEAGRLSSIANSSYDVLLSSHVIEHLANPIAALAEWRRVLKENGTLLLVAPHREATFDWRRHVTTMEHLKNDFAASTPESDLSHLPEILELHDLERDRPAGDLTQFETRCRNNLQNRGMHHHVFDTLRIIELVEACDFVVDDALTLLPFHIAVIARKSDVEPSPIYETLKSKWVTASCFRSDKSR